MIYYQRLITIFRVIISRINRVNQILQTDELTILPVDSKFSEENFTNEIICLQLFTTKNSRTFPDYSVFRLLRMLPKDSVKIGQLDYDAR